MYPGVFNYGYGGTEFKSEILFIFFILITVTTNSIAFALGEVAIKRNRNWFM